MRNQIDLRLQQLRRKYAAAKTDAEKRDIKAEADKLIEIRDRKQQPTIPEIQQRLLQMAREKAMQQ